MKASRFALLIASCLPLMPLNALAQAADNAEVNDRINHVEHDVMLLQQQVARGGGSGSPVTGNGGDADTPAGGSAQLEVRLSGIEDQIRELRGKVEEEQNRNAKLTETLDKLQRDMEFRFSELNGAKTAAPTPVNLGAPPPVTTTPDAIGNGGTVKPLGTIPAQTRTTPIAQPQAAAPDAAAKQAATEDPSGFATPRELYNYAFRLLNQTQYEEAASAFDSFTKKYPKDALVGNAFYWEGETYYIRRDYVNAADYFRQGFEAVPEGPKAADNLLKLALSLNALSRDKESCVVLQQVIAKFKKTASSVADRAETESKRIGCSKSGG